MNHFKQTKYRIQDIIFQVQFKNRMALFSPNHMTQTLSITFPTGIRTPHIPTAHKENSCFMHTTTNRPVKTLLLIARCNSKE